MSTTVKEDQSWMREQGEQSIVQAQRTVHHCTFLRVHEMQIRVQAISTALNLPSSFGSMLIFLESASHFSIGRIICVSRAHIESS